LMKSLHETRMDFLRNTAVAGGPVSYSFNCLLRRRIGFAGLSGPDVLVEPEKIRGVVLPLDPDEPIVI
jgi:hypothetical protein